MSFGFFMVRSARAALALWTDPPCAPQPPQLISSFTKGAINVHPSDLPRVRSRNRGLGAVRRHLTRAAQYRGSSPLQYALLDGASETAVSVIDVHPERFDAGRVLARRAVAVAGDDSFTRCAAGHCCRAIGLSRALGRLVGSCHGRGRAASLLAAQRLARTWWRGASASGRRLLQRLRRRRGRPRWRPKSHESRVG